MKLLKYFIFLSILIIGIFICLYYCEIYFPASKSDNKISLVIEKGESLKNIALDLENKNIIRDSFWMRLYFKLNNLSKNIIADEFEVSSNMSIKQIAKIITNKNNNEIKLTIIEGWNASQISDYLSKKGICKQDEWNNFLSGHSFNYEFLETKPKNANLEGYLFPDTYNVYKNASCETVMKKMLDNFGNKIDNKILSDIKNQGKNLYDVLILASIIELEVPDNYDRAQIADIFLKRLDVGIALQSDATINYITGNGHVRPSYNETRMKSPYNTYLNKGLPPTPISNPGLSAIKAVVYPTHNPYYYFLTTKDGRVIYSKTFEEHKKNKALYLD